MKQASHSFTYQDQIEHLKNLLNSFSNFRGAKGQFVLKYNDRTGKQYGRNLINKILKHEINFSRNEDVTIAIEIAEKLYLEYAYVKSGGALHALDQDTDILHVSYISEVVHLADSMFAQGQNHSAYELMIKLAARIDLKSLYRSDEFLFAYFHLVFGKLKMQAGMMKGNQSALSHIESSYDMLKKQGEYEHLRAATSIMGHVYRGLYNTYLATKAFEDISKLAYRFDKRKQLDVLNNTDHQLALTLVQKHHSLEGATDLYLNRAVDLMQKSNTYFKEQEHHESWYRFALVREAELLLTQGNKQEAGLILEQFDDLENFLLLDVGKQVILLRLRCEWHLQNDDVSKAVKDYRIAHQLATKHHFNKELMLLKMMFFTHSRLRKQLPDSFYVHTPGRDEKSLDALVFNTCFSITEKACMSVQACMGGREYY